MNLTTIFECQAQGVADLNATTVEVKSYGDGFTRYTFTVPLDHGAELEAYVRANDEHMEFADLLTRKHRDHPAAFSTGAGGVYYGTGVRMGSAETRRIIRYIVDRVRKDHPAIRTLSTTRVTGARSISGKRTMDATLPASMLSEANLPAPIRQQQIDPALLTAREYQQIINRSEKSHPSNAYESTVAEMNRFGDGPSTYPKLVQRLRIAGLEFEFRLKTEKNRYVKHTPDGEILRVDGDAQYWSDEEVVKLGKPLDDHSLAIFHEDKRVGLAQDEWGCVLVAIAIEYQGFGLGTILQKMMRTIYPDKTSGGFTPQGSKGFARVHREFVRDALKNGTYGKLVRAGQMTMDRVREITASAQIKDAPRRAPIRANYGASDPANWVLFVGEYGDFVLYDRNLKDMVDEGGERADFFMEKMILGACNVRALDTREGEFGILTLFGGDTPQVRGFMMKLALSFAQQEGMRLMVDQDDDLQACRPAFAEMVGEGNMDTGFRRQQVKLVGEPLPYRAMGNAEARWRKGFDQYDEFKHRVMEMGHAKFRVEPADPKEPRGRRWQ